MTMLPLLYFLVGYICLALAFAAVAVAPGSLSGFFYHARLIGVVHLVTLGWITSGLLGALYLVLPLLFRSELHARRGDYAAFASFAIGLIGMVAHFWIHEFSGMAWSALMVVLAVIHVGVRIVPRVMRAPLATGIKLPFVLAFVNLAVAGIAGVVLGFDKVHQFLPGYVVSNVLAHAHLAALGWAAMLVLGLAHVMLPVVPLERLDGRAAGISAVWLEVAALGVGGTLIAGSRWAAFFALVAAAVFARFVADVLRLHRRRPAATVLRPDVGGWHLIQAGVYVVSASALGVALAWMTPSPLSMRLAMIYGVCGLVGFLAQALMGLQMRLVPLAFHAHPNRPCAVPAFVLWTASIPVLAIGFLLDAPLLLSTGGAGACVATVAAGMQGALVISGPLPLPTWISWKRDDRRRRGAAHQLALPQSRS